MSTNGVNITEDAEMAECDGDKVVTMIDVLQEQQDFEENVNAVLGASDDKNCTYTKGYIKRQALYACLTCCSEAKEDPTKRAGVCLACSLTCHENHDLVELYTKRNFRCDCGNPKFNSHPCTFAPDKTDLNEENSYNQNFSGLYCICHKPYPDLDGSLDEDMIQCIICEDWLHASHLEAVAPPNDQYAEMICKACMENNEFLHDYSGLAVNVETGDVDVVTVNGKDSVCNGELENNTITKPDTEDKVAEIDVEMAKDKVDRSEVTESPKDDKVIEDVPKTTEDKISNDNDIELTDNVEENRVTRNNVDAAVDSTTENKEHTSSDEGTSKAENVHDKKMDLDNEKQETEELIEKTNAESGEENIEDTIVNTTTQNGDSSEVKPIDNESSDKTDHTTAESDEKTGNDSETEVSNNVEEQRKASEQSSGAALEQNTEQLTNNEEKDKPKIENIAEKTDSSKDNEKTEDQQLFDDPNSTANKTDPTNAEKTEDQQLLDDLNELTSDKQESDITSTQEDTIAEDKSKDAEETTNEDERNPNDSDNTVPESNGSTEIEEAMETNEILAEEANNKEIADTSENIQTEKENNEKTDEVMCAIDEILEGSEAKPETVQENASMGEDNKPASDHPNDSAVTNKCDVEMSEDKEPSEVSEQTEATSDDASKESEVPNENEPKQDENKVNAHKSENKDINDKELVDTEKTAVENKIDNEMHAQEVQSDAATDKEIKETPIEESIIPKVSESNESDQTKHVMDTENSNKENETLETDGKNIELNDNKNDATEKVPILTENTNINKRKLDTEDKDVSTKKAKLDEVKSCIRPKGVKKVFKGATFWPSNFRQKLCTCGECISMYKDLNVLFLIDPEDTVTAYESLGKENVRASQYEKGLEALSSLDRIQQINALTEYNKMRDKLLDFLKSFKDRKEVVKEEDIKAFFAGMKPRREPDGVYFCR